ncbi:MAG: zinc ABC transporter substrate-binding protein [Verrucomicrobiota bacterium JB023]|nr:zinc ABC transporter substrate-binding protein [Verrucomicrobiota bacterium JB023]
MKHFFLALFGLSLLACKPPESAQTAKPDGAYSIVTTVGMITDITKNIVGDDGLASVQGLIGTGIDPHLYKPTRDDILTLQKADIVFYNGLHLEGKLTDILEKIGEKKPVHAVADGIPSEFFLNDENKQHDPHLWMDVTLWLEAAESITGHLSAYDPENEARYRANFDAYAEKIAGLDAYAKQAIATIPEDQRVLITAHDAFSYFGKAYGIEVRGIQGLSTESEAGVWDIERMTNFMIERNIPALFVESSVSDKHVRALIEGCAAKGHQVTVGGELFSDAMGPTGSYEGTYLGMIDHNVTVIANALGGQAAGFRNQSDTEDQ